jgi:tRNA nucleotidyltransferase/poly(A) polymerase
LNEKILSETVNLPPIVESIRAILPPEGKYLVGGAIRDALLGRPVCDIDIALQGDGVDAARTVANALQAAFYPLDAERGVGRVILVRDRIRYTLDFATLRGKEIRDDLAARDFTINAIAVPLARPRERIDPLNGEHDLRLGILRACSPQALKEDPVRVIRAVRLASQLDLLMDEATQEQARTGASGLDRVSAERIRDEFFRILAGKRVASGIRLLTALGILARILPETAGLEKTTQPAPHRYDVWTHTLLAVEKLDTLMELLLHGSADATPKDTAFGTAAARLSRFQPMLLEHLTRPLSDDRPVHGLMFLAALLHDAGKPDTRSVNASGETHFLGHEQLGEEWAFRRAMALRFSSEEAGYVAHIVRHHMRPLLLRAGGEITRRAVFRYYRSTGPSGVAVCLFSLADTLATYGLHLPKEEWRAAVETASSLLEGYFERSAEVVYPVPLLTGNDLLREFGLLPGPQIGELMDTLREAQAAGEINSCKEALALVSRALGRHSG